MGGVAAAAAAVVIFVLARRSGAGPKATLVCARCGHRFEVTAREYRAAPSSGGGPAVRCPKCSQIAAEPLLATCPHCNKPILRSEVDPSSQAYAQRLCPHCGKAVAP